MILSTARSEEGGRRSIAHLVETSTTCSDSSSSTSDTSSSSSSSKSTDSSTSSSSSSSNCSTQAHLKGPKHWAASGQGPSSKGSARTGRGCAGSSLGEGSAMKGRRERRSGESDGMDSSAGEHGGQVAGTGGAKEQQQQSAVVNSVESVKRYKNSPFGLTRHYLTMPDDGAGSEKAATNSKRHRRQNSRALGRTNEPRGNHNGQVGSFSGSDDDDDSDKGSIERVGKLRGSEGGKGKKFSWDNKEASNKSLSSAQSCADLTHASHESSNACDLSVLAPSSSVELASLSPAWPEDAASYADVGSRSGVEAGGHQHRTSHSHRLGHNHNHSRHLHSRSHRAHHASQADPRHFTRPSNAPLPLPLGCPASDAGLDAKKCNAKDAEGVAECYFAAEAEAEAAAVAGGSDAHHLSDKLKMAELASPAQEPGGLLVRFSSIIYATFLVILGCILHVSELRQKSKNSSDHIYTIIVALIGILWLAFLQADLQRYKKYASKYILIETIFNDHQQKRRELLQLGSGSSGACDPMANSTASSSASLVNDRMSMNTEVIFKKTAYKMYQQRAALDRQQAQAAAAAGVDGATGANGAHKSHHHLHAASASGGQVHSPAKLAHLSGVPLNDPCAAISSKAGDPSGAGGAPSLGEQGSDCRNLVPAYKFLHGKMGANFYLKCGMAAFCFGHVIHEGLRFGQQLYFFGTSNTQCRDSAALVAHLITPLYSFYQLFMMFKYSNLVINRHKILARFGLMHIIGTSVTFWFRTILEEAFEDFVHKMDYFKTNKPQINVAPISHADSDSSLVSLFTSITNAIKTEASERSDWSFAVPGDQSQGNMTRAQSLLTLMSSPISATITPQMVRHLPESYACAQNTLLTTKSMNALPYLYPFTIEYNLLLAATFLSLYFNIGKVGLTSAGESACRPFLFSNTRSYKPQSLTSSPGSHSEQNDNASAIRMGLEGHEREIGEYKSNFVVNADCHSANKGLFCGFFVLLVTLVTIVIFFVTINKPTHIQLGIKINLIQEATLTALILIVTLAGFKQVVKLNRNPYLKDKVTTDDVLMLIPLPFFFIHSLLSFRAETASMSSGSVSYFSSKLLQGNHNHDSVTSPTGNLQSILLSTNNNNSTQLETRSRRLNNLLAGHPNGTNGRFVEDFISNTNSGNGNSNNRNSSNINVGAGSSSSSSSSGNSLDVGSNNSSQIDHFKLITVALNIIVMIEVLVQTNFIIDGMRRCSESRYLRFKKPGRELVTFAILLNITYWIVATFETKSVEQYKTEIEYYGPLPYMFISHTTLPVMLFYRYHSSVCLAEIWNRAYKPPKKR